MSETMGENRADPRRERSRHPIALKRRIIELFAQFHTVTQIRGQILKEFGVDLDARSIGNYDPEGYARIGQGLRSYFDECRKAYGEALGKQAVAHQTHRLKLIGQIVESASKSKDYNAALKGLELAAREMGGQLTNVQRREVSGTMEHRHLSVEDARAELAMRLGAILDGGALAALPPPDPVPAPAPVATAPVEAPQEGPPSEGDGLDFGGFRPDLAKG